MGPSRARKLIKNQRSPCGDLGEKDDGNVHELSSPENIVSGWWQSKNFGSRAIDAFKASRRRALRMAGKSLRAIAQLLDRGFAHRCHGFGQHSNICLMRDRIIGTFLGWVTFYVWHGHYLLYGLSVTLCIFVCSMLAFEKTGRLAAVALSIKRLDQDRRCPPRPRGRDFWRVV
jgi:hypothetical protein